MEWSTLKGQHERKLRILEMRKRTYHECRQVH